MTKSTVKIAERVLRLRISQLLVNERLKKGEFKIPIHLAFGHEAIAVAIDQIMKTEDGLFLSHRNIHYNLARTRSLKEVLDEFYLRESGIAKGHLGSMNLCNPSKNVVYTSNILANNHAVSSGYALGNRIRGNNGVVFTVTGDGAIEEGCFYESMLFQKSNNLSVVTVVENNRWSLATEIGERRCEINLKKLTSGLSIDYFHLKGNDVFNYIERLSRIRTRCLKTKSPVCVEVHLNTLGYSYKKEVGNPKARYINYHAGAAAQIESLGYPLISQSSQDPIFVLQKSVSQGRLKELAKNIASEIEAEIS
ncbi:hypothetical protein D4R75_08385 [bacterium]|nr:MAG: hypothetical protein D4R75_08385 [bacterium]